MTDAAKNLTEIYDDIDLCYKVMGLSFSDPPEKVDRIYKGLIEEYTKNLQSSDPNARKEAQTNLEQTRDLYERITSSLIYKDYAREYAKYKALKEAEKQEKLQKAEAEKDLMVNCPYCNKKISPQLKVCMYCHGKILSPMELVMKKLFTRNSMIIMAVVLFLVAALIVFAFNPNMFK